MEKKLVVITGASSGIGKATAKRFSKLGHPMLLLGRKLENIDSYENTIVKSVDVTDLEAMRAAIQEAESKFGPTEILINNAGIMILDHLKNQNPKEWKDMYDINVLGVLNGIHCVVEGMAKRRSGTIINLSSLAGIKTNPIRAAYSGTKAAVRMISESLREELAASEVRVTVVSPAIVNTNLLSSFSNMDVKKEYERYRDEEIDGSLSPDDVANVIEYICALPQHVCLREVVLSHTKQKM